MYTVNKTFPEVYNIIKLMYNTVNKNFNSPPYHTPIEKNLPILKRNILINYQDFFK